MLLITQRMKIRGVAEAWRRQYGNAGGLHPGVRERLDALDKENATATDVSAIIGNSSWTDIRCNECGTYVERAVQVGEPPDWESATALICERCARSALTLISEGR